MCLNKAKLDSDDTLSYSITLPSLQKIVTVVHGTFYSVLSTPIKQRELVLNNVW